MANEPVKLDMSTSQPIAPVKLDMSTSQPLDSEQVPEKSMYQKLTEVDQTTKNPALRFLSNVGATVIGAPAAIGSAILHAPTTVKNMGNAVNSAIDDYSNPETRPTLEGVLSVLPEALGQGVGNVAAGEATGLAMKGAAAGARALVPKGVPEYLYRTALKPSTTIPEAKASAMINTGLDYGIPVSKGGLEKLGSLIDDLNDKIKTKIDTASDEGVTIDPNKVANRVDSLKSKFSNQVNPESDLAAIESSKQEFLRNYAKPIDPQNIAYHGASPGSAELIRKTGMITAGDLTTDLNRARLYSNNSWNPNAESGTVFVVDRSGAPGLSARLKPVKVIGEVGPSGEIVPSGIPASQAQSIKQGTYQQLKSKAYGEMKSATIESQKALARGIKEELVNAFPELKNLNAEDSRLLNLDPVLEKAVNRIGNHQIIGIGTPIVAGAAKAVTGSTGIGAVAGIIKGVVDLPIVKSRLAIALRRQGLSPRTAMDRVAAYSSALGAASSAAQNENQ